MTNTKLNQTSIKKTSNERFILAVNRSLKHIYCDIIDPKSGRVLGSASDLDINSGTKIERATKVGEKLAEVAKSHKIKLAVFDRRGYKYHGRVKALAEAARKNGLEF